MQLTLPRSDRHTQVAILISHPQGVIETVLDDTHKVLDVKLPEGVSPDDVEIAAQFLNRRGEPDLDFPGFMVKEKVASASEPEVKSEVESSEPSVAAQPSDGADANLGSEDSRHDYVAGVTDAGPVGEAGVKQETHAEPSTTEEVTVRPPAVREHHKPRVPHK